MDGDWGRLQTDLLVEASDEGAGGPVEQHDRRAFTYPDNQTQPPVQPDDIVDTQTERMLRLSPDESEQVGLFAAGVA